jgi:NADH-quinone oxidoreductase subunit J
MENFIFFLFYFLIIFNAMLIILSKNPIHSIFFLVLVFLIATVLLIFMGIEFVAMLFLIVYVGAIIVLFLFVIMMLNVKILEYNERVVLYVPMAVFLGAIFIYEIFYASNFSSYFFFMLESNKKDFDSISIYTDFFKNLEVLDTIGQLGMLLYGKFVYFFFLSSIILLIAMIGAITLTLNQKFSSKRQDIYKQTTRTLKNSLRYLRNSIKKI